MHILIHQSTNFEIKLLQTAHNLIKGHITVDMIIKLNIFST